MRGNESPSIIDVVASGDEPLGYPIEVGVVLANGQRYCSIIKPAKDWSHWDTNREAEHGITRDSLENNGQVIEVVAQQLNELLAGKTVYCDIGESDNKCLEKLFHQCGVAMDFKVVQLKTIVQEGQIAFWDQINEKLLNTSKIQRARASNNAWILQRCFVLSRQKVQSSGESVIKRVG